jgi:UDP-2,3-diacylglucosamine pyrophosphatase LpxH
VISDVHLGTYGCHAEELLEYLKSIKPKALIINGDFIDAWQFKKRYFPKAHLELIQHVIEMAISGVKVYYITGNHDDILRKFSDVSIGPIVLKDSLVLKLNGKKHLFFHGDIFDTSVLISPTLAMLGGKGYDYLIRLNRMINSIRERFGKPRISFSKRLKNSVKQAVKFIGDFELLAIKHAVKNQCDYVICGHIHRPVIRKNQGENRSVTYMNSGDWIENLSALELVEGQWRLFMFEESDLHKIVIPKSNGEMVSTSALRKSFKATKDLLRFW